MTMIMTEEKTLEEIGKKRKRLIYRSWHRGTREMDLLMGSFADRYVPEFSPAELSQYEDILGYSDPDLYNWISGREECPSGLAGPVMKKLLGHSYNESYTKA